MTARVLDDAECVRMHRDEGLSVTVIAARFNVIKPSIYRAFRRSGYAPHGLYVLKGENLKKAQPKQKKVTLYPRAVHNAGYHKGNAGPAERDYRAEQEALNARRILPRDPCPRCGARGDIGCKHSGLPRMGWSVG